VSLPHAFGSDRATVPRSAAHGSVALHGDPIGPNAHKDAVRELAAPLGDAESPIDKAIVADWLNLIIGMDRTLAQTAIDDASAAPGSDPAWLDNANRELAHGDADLADGKLTAAVDHYGKAWRAALKAV